MRLLHPSIQILPHLEYHSMLHLVCRASSLCYGKEMPDGQKAMESYIVARLSTGHQSVIEHVGFSALFQTDRGITHELVRHRLASFTQSSTRFIGYDKGGHVPFIMPKFMQDVVPCGNYSVSERELINEDTGESFHFEALSDGGLWATSMYMAEAAYLALRQGETEMSSPEMARSLLPQSTMAQIVVTANMREWRHIFSLRILGTTGRPHPQMQEVMGPLLSDAKQRFPAFFADM